MGITVFARPGTDEQFIDMRDNPVCPDGMIKMNSERPLEGNWIAQPDRTWAEKTITPEELAEAERQWAMTELALSDRLLTPDFPSTETHREKILEYRARLRNPARSDHPDFPSPTWRPQWPEGVKRPAQ